MHGIPIKNPHASARAPWFQISKKKTVANNHIRRCIRDDANTLF